MDSLVSLLRTVIKWGLGLVVLVGLGVAGLLGYENWERQLVVKAALKCELLEGGSADRPVDKYNYPLLVGRRDSKAASSWYQPVRTKYEADVVGRGGWEVKTLNFDGVVYLRVGSVVVNEDGEYAYRQHWPGKLEADDYSRWIDRRSLKYVGYALKDGKRDLGMKVTRQCEIVTTGKIASELSGKLVEIPEYKI